MPAADRVAGDHRDDRLGQAADLDVQVGDVEAPDASLAGRVLVEVARVAAHALVAARAERVGALAGQHDHADLGVLAGVLERAEISTIVRGRKAFRTSGRAIVIFAMPASSPPDFS